MRASAGKKLVVPGMALLLLAAAVSVARADGIPMYRSAVRAQALAALSGEGPRPADCITPLLQSVRQDPATGTAAVRRAVALLQSEPPLLGERRIVERDGTVIRYSVDRASMDRVDATDGDGDGRPDIVERVLDGLATMRHLLVDQMGLPAPAPADVVLARLGGAVDGYLVQAGRRDGRLLLVIESAPRGGTDAAREEAMHQLAHAVVLASGPVVPPAAFGEALATWAVLKLTGGPDGRTTALLAERLARLDAGLATDDLTLAPGNAAWFAFLDEAYGPTAVGLSVEENATGAAPAAAFDRALRRAVGVPFTSAFRDFHLWSILTGARADGRHFSFADRLPSPSFVDTVEGLPALSVQAGPAVSPLGAAHVLFRPSETGGGMKVRFEGEVGSRWEADLLLMDPLGHAMRLALPLSAESSGEVTVPLGLVAEAILLVRNLDGDTRAPRRYTWSAQREAGYPCEISAVDLLRADVPAGAVLVAWETTSESALAGFNVLRRREGAPGEIRINPIWVPPLGDAATPAAYQFLDTTVAPGNRYVYRIEAVTPEGLSDFSEPVVSGPIAPAR
jgi:hypothetical protein